MGFYGNYILVKKKGVSRYSANDRIYIQSTQLNTQVIYNLIPVTAVGTDNPLFPVTADLTLARGGEGINFFETIQFDRTLRDNARRTVAECTELLRTAT